MQTPAPGAFPGRNGEFAAAVAHELRNFLAPLASSIDILRARDDAATVRELLPVMDRQVAQMGRLVDDLVHGAAGEIVLAPHTLQLQPALHDAAESLAHVLARREQRLELDLCTAPLWVRADPLRLAQILANLLTNASKYTPPGGHIRLGARADAAEACIVVADPGVGIPASELPHVFELYRQVPGHAALSLGGRGIGLWVVRRLVELHGGTVRAASDGPGRGSRFEVRLPLQRPATPAPSWRPRSSMSGCT